MMLILSQTFIGAVVSHFTSCSSISAWFTVGGCATARDSRAQIISLYYAFAVDVISDLMIMALPIGLIWNLKLSAVKKAGIIALFCVGWAAIAAAIVRVVSIGVRAGSSTPSSTWLAFWGIIETGIVVIIGTAPGLYSTARKAHTSRKETKYAGYPGSYQRHTGDVSSKTPQPVLTSMASKGFSTHTVDDDEERIFQPSMVDQNPAEITTSFPRPIYLHPKRKGVAGRTEGGEDMELRPRNEWSSRNILVTRQFTVRKG